ncbi:unnamed protein product [Effrenium voratum]|uniref:Uncharacterized protein n=1 Tax=Effrenium voratum TaxID=2562239 RepID=A0AA36J5S8_9DINO|nr:unnamed protein product [Effrenium voratum]CAJ1399090.1 unnamed protein product [Effrenium voratum]CAJ1432212.1 unnamed protein product [Effrenium voratum]|mmetsp:Transcript_107327/g.256323  ORF Transcript_107327/g.256323 Transcript_107327/m.256323 type:complete len:219 (-) Transcript_107327:106-762(-)
MRPVLNLNARDRAVAAAAAAARYGKEPPLKESELPRTPLPQSRPSSAKRSARPSSAGTTRTRTSGRSSARSSKSSGWMVGLTVPRSFVEISGNQPIEWLEMNLGPKEVLFREAGARLEAAALEAAAQEAQLACDGPEKRRNAEQKLRENRNSQGEPWRHCRGGGRRGAPRHLASRRNRASGAGACGLFSDVPSLEASESAARAGARPRRPASAASVQR